MIGLAWTLFAICLFIPIYAYGIYPALLRIAPARKRGAMDGEESEWPVVTFSIPAYNEEAQIAETLQSVLASDYPSDRRQIIVASDASTDATDEIVRKFSGEGVQLVRMQTRSGKTATEREIAKHVRGDI